MKQDYDYNSPQNQKIKSTLVGREVLANITDMAGYLFDDDGDKYASFDEFDNYWACECPQCGAVNSFNSDEREIDDFGTEEYWFCEDCGHEEDDDPKREAQEVYEYWIVSPWFGQKLRDHREVVLERLGGWIWGRCCTGQAIYLDNAIDEICEGMEILQGMRNEWKV